MTVILQIIKKKTNKQTKTNKQKTKQKQKQTNKHVIYYISEIQTIKVDQRQKDKTFPLLLCFSLVCERNT